MKTRDIDIRTELHKRLDIVYKKDPSTRVIDELSLCQGDARIDVAVINGSMHGYEIKSDKDTLERLNKQMSIYNKIFDTVTLIAGSAHMDKVFDEAPSWWGIVEASTNKEKVKLKQVRKPKKNKDIDAYSLAQLLWRDEALDILKEKGLQKGYLSKPRNEIWKRLSDSLPLNELRVLVREKLKSRENWRVH